MFLVLKISNYWHFLIPPSPISSAYVIYEWSLSNPCLNGGTCVDGLNMYRCNCHPGTFGRNCSKVCPHLPNNEITYTCIEGTGYFFETNKLTFVEAKSNCLNKFGGNNGRLWEPRFQEVWSGTTDQVFLKSKSVSGKDTRILGLRLTHIDTTHSDACSNVNVWVLQIVLLHDCSMSYCCNRDRWLAKINVMYPPSILYSRHDLSYF